MGFSINSNPFANIVQTELYLNTPALTQAITRLSTGLRINSAADDPAGLAITNNLQAQVSGLDQNQLNIQDSISLVQTASQSLSGTQTILENMLQLATRAATGTNSSSDVAAMQTEMNQLAQQITGTANSTTFNSQNLLAGALQNFQTQLGPDAGDSSSFSIAPMDAASIGVAGSAANITAAQNTANVNALSEVGTGFLGANQGESYQIAATTITTGGAGGTYNLVGAASANGTAAQNLGKESLGVSGAGAATTLYTVQVTGVTNGAITAIRYATGTGTPTWTNVTATSGNFSLGGTLVGAFTNGAATPQAGDQFTFTTNGGGTAGAVTAGTNADSNSTGVVGGAYTGTTNLQYVVRASGIDGANNVNTVQVSTDGGQTFGSSIAISAGTFALGNGLNFTWNKGYRESRAGGSQWRFIFVQRRGGQSKRAVVATLGQHDGRRCREVHRERREHRLRRAVECRPDERESGNRSPDHHGELWRAGYRGGNPGRRYTLYRCESSSRHREQWYRCGKCAGSGGPQYRDHRGGLRRDRADRCRHQCCLGPAKLTWRTTNRSAAITGAGDCRQHGSIECHQQHSRCEHRSRDGQLDARAHFATIGYRTAGTSQSNTRTRAEATRKLMRGAHGCGANFAGEGALSGSNRYIPS